MPASRSLPTSRLPRAAAASLRVPGVWSGADWQRSVQAAVQATGFEALDAELPGGGWPLGSMSEILLPEHWPGPWTLLAPALAVRLAGGLLRAVLVGPPQEPWLPALQAMGVAAGQLCCIACAHTAAAERSRLWATEQALRCQQVGAVLAWLPEAPVAALRRLQLTAAQQGQLLWVLRPEKQRLQSSPAALRLWLQSEAAPAQAFSNRVHDSMAAHAFTNHTGTGRTDAAQRMLLQVHLIKRQGPPLSQPIELPLLPPLLQAALAAQAVRRRQLQQQEMPVRTQSLASPATISSRELVHALAGLASVRV